MLKQAATLDNNPAARIADAKRHLQHLRNECWNVICEGRIPDIDIRKQVLREQLTILEIQTDKVKQAFTRIDKD